MPKFAKGDPVVFYKEKHSASPGKRAKDIAPAPKGDEYSYVVEKYWTVRSVEEDGTLKLVTRRGKEHQVDADDICLRKPRWWEKLIYRNRFPTLG